MWADSYGYTAYVGNGKFGLSTDTWQPFYIAGKRALSLDKQLPYCPIIGFKHDSNLKSIYNFPFVLV